MIESGKSEVKNNESLIDKESANPLGLVGKKFKYLIVDKSQLRFSNELKGIYPANQELLKNVEIVGAKPLQIKGELVQYEFIFNRTYGKEAEKFLNFEKSLFFNTPYVRSGWQRLKETISTNIKYYNFGSIALLNENDVEKFEIVVNLSR